MLNNVDAITFPTQGVKFDYYKTFPQFNDKMLIDYPMGIKPKHTPIIAEIDQGLRIGIMNFITYIKGWVPMVNVIRMCEDKRLPVKFVFSAELDANQKEYLGACSNVEFGKAYQNVNLVWMPTIAKETFSLVASESIKYGFPVMCRHYGAFAERLGTDVAYFYEEGSNVEGIFELIWNISQNLDLLSAKQEAAKKMSDDIPTLDYMVLKFESLYEKMLTK
jgi:glycosyltransferase involved in cell wall biosynthesis